MISLLYYDIITVNDIIWLDNDIILLITGRVNIIYDIIDMI
jgi:hypothetical protein